MPVLEWEGQAGLCQQSAGRGRGIRGSRTRCYTKKTTRMFYGDAKKLLDALLPMID